MPLIGAGLSRNAVVGSGAAPPDWNGLAEGLRAELADPEDATDAVEVISAYAHAHGRPALVERVAKAIRAGEAAPGEVHQALCRLPLSVLMTTNFDNLLEDAFRSLDKPCHAVIDEPQLALKNPFPGPTLLKVHGDLSRPDRMILTEADFDTFLGSNPLLATVIASHFAQRSVVLIGYSLSDPDLRSILAVVRERLGHGARAIYSLEVGATDTKIARFERRGVRVVNLPGAPSKPGPTLRDLFTEIFEATGNAASNELVPITHRSESAVRSAEAGRSCFLAVSVESSRDFDRWLGPISAELRIPLLRFQDLVAPNKSPIAAVDAMLAASGCALVELASAWTDVELGMALNRLGAERVLLVAPRGRLVPDPAHYRTVVKPASEEEWVAFTKTVQRWWTEIFNGE